MSSTNKSVKDKDLKNGCFDVLITLDDIIVAFFCYFELFGAKVPCLPFLWKNCCKMCLKIDWFVTQSDQECIKDSDWSHLKQLQLK